eukprot:403350575
MVCQKLFLRFSSVAIHEIFKQKLPQTKQQFKQKEKVDQEGYAQIDFKGQIENAIKWKIKQQKSRLQITNNHFKER